MNIIPVFLWTDILLYILIIAIVLFLKILNKNIAFKNQLLSVFKRPINMIALVILLFYVLLGVLDSFHYKIKTETQVKSVLDIIVSPVQDRVEKTYSAPFATHSFVSEIKKNKLGKDESIYPKLKYGGQHLTDGQSRIADILTKIFQGMGLGLGFSIFLFCVFSKVFKLKLSQFIKGQTLYPWRSFWITLSIIISFVCLSKLLIPYYHLFGTDKVGADVFYSAINIICVRFGMI